MGSERKRQNFEQKQRRASLVQPDEKKHSGLAQPGKQKQADLAYPDEKQSAARKAKPSMLDTKYRKKPNDQALNSYQGDELRQSVAKMLDDLIMKQGLPTFVQFCQIVKKAYDLADRTDENSSKMKKFFGGFAGALTAMLSTPFAALGGTAMTMLSGAKELDPRKLGHMAKGFKKTGFQLPDQYNRELEEVKEPKNKQVQDRKVQDRKVQDSKVEKVDSRLQEDLKQRKSPGLF